jgi:CIC family chloride channel protein
LIVRELFGYSFATWRFHLRGEVIRGPQDIGWIQQINANSLMRADFENALNTMSIREAQKLFSPTLVRQVVLRDPNGIYAGIVLSADLHSIATDDNSPLSTLAKQVDEFLLPGASIRDVIAAFERSETDVLAIVDRADHRAAIGTVTESHVLRTYGEELERRNQEMFFR